MTSLHSSDILGIYSIFVPALGFSPSLNISLQQSSTTFSTFSLFHYIFSLHSFAPNNSAGRFYNTTTTRLIPKMYSILPLASSVLLASGALAQYGYGGGAGMSSSMATDLAPSSSMPVQDMAGSSTMSAASTMAGAAAPSGTGRMVNMHVVKVSNKNGDLVFEPKDMQAKVGEMVQFQFYPKVCLFHVMAEAQRLTIRSKNHSVVQASFDMPCMPMKNSMGMKGLFSGYMPVKPTDTTMPAYTIMVNDTKPIWYYCSQGNHCQSGMVGVINA